MAAQIRSSDGARVSKFHVLWFTTFAVLFTGIPFGESQPGFLSIDCGRSQAYTDTRTGIYWVPDDNYTFTGTNILLGAVPDDQLYSVQEQLSTIRQFNDSTPNGNKNCYYLPTKVQTRYLMRPSFILASSADGLGSNGIGDSPNQFDMYLNSTLIRTLYFDYYTSQNYFYIQIIFQSPGGDVSLCLVTTSGNPFITSLELRELENGMYSYDDDDGKSLSNSEIFLLGFSSFTTGSNMSTRYRYPDDPYDRYWSTVDAQSYFSNTRVVSNRSSIPPATSTTASNLPPVSVMKTAVMGNETRNVTLKISSLPHNPVYITGYFQELDGNASSTNVRGMEFFINGQRRETFNSSNQVVQVEKSMPASNNTSNFVTIARAPWSRLPPILNAMEIYLAVDVNTSHTKQEDVDAVYALTSRIPTVPRWRGDPCLPVSFSWLSCTNDADNTPYRIIALKLQNLDISGAIPQEVFMLDALTNLTMSNNKLNGSISADFSKLTYLQYLFLDNNKLDGNINNLKGLQRLQNLYLNNNSFSGDITNFFSTFNSLTELRVDNNNFSGFIPRTLENRPEFNFSNNPNLIPRSASSGGSSGLSNGGLAGIILGSILALAIIGAILWCFLTRKKRATARILQEMHKGDSGNIGNKAGSLQLSLEHLRSLNQYSLQEVREATNRFSRKIGEGGFGQVFYGKLPNGQEVAVKYRKEASRDGLPALLNELELLSRIHHRNLVSLVGYCGEGGQHILLLPYLPNGSLDTYTHGDKSKPGLDWKTRLAIATNSAVGLEYLHFHCDPQIIHGDVKSANILLDKNMVAKVSDFGTSRETLEGKTRGVSTVAKGTPGYWDPEFLLSQRLTPTNDVYSFGVMLLEIISGRPALPMENLDGSYMSLIQWARHRVQMGQSDDIFDPKMEKKFNYQSARMVLDLALQCANPTVETRPDMQYIVSQLTHAQHLEDPAPDRSEETDPLIDHQELEISISTSGRFPADSNPSTQSSHVLGDNVVDVDAR